MAFPASRSFLDKRFERPRRDAPLTHTDLDPRETFVSKHTPNRIRVHLKSLCA